jgi:serine protease AprX
MAGIIAGDGTSSAGKWRGVATKAKLVSVKLAGADGSTDVSMVIAGMQWVIAHKDQFGIRVMNLSFGTDSIQGYAADPLDYAVEQVWLSGIVVVASAGNRGPTAGTISKPADDPFAISVGAADVLGTPLVTDDMVATFSGHGPTPDGMAKPDLVAPGVTIVANRAAGSTLDLTYPDARVDDDYFRGTGTSQAAAIVSGVAALVIQSSPSITPDVVKATLAGTANAGMAGLDGAGAGMIDAKRAISAAGRHTFDTQPANDGLVPSAGTGPLEGSRGTVRVLSDFNGDGMDDAIAGEMDPLGNSWDGASWGASAWNGSGWRPYVSVAYGWGTSKDGNSWDGTSWDTSSWEGNSWDGNSWEGNSWGYAP